MRIKLFFIFFILSVILYSCSVERKIAQSFVNDKQAKSLLLFWPSQLIKENLKTKELTKLDSLNPQGLDFVLYTRSLFLQNINDSIFMGKLKKSMIDELNAHGYKVYGPDQLEEFMNLKDSSYVLNLSQMQIEEYVYTATVQTPLEFDYYFAGIDLNAINLNSWFELKRNQVPQEQYPVLYSSYFIYDDFEGDFFRSSKNGKINYRYKVDSLEIKDIYNLAELAGKKYATNFYDYMLNIFVQDKLPKDKVPAFYYHYNRKAKALQTYYNDAFVEMDPEK
jgi:hypothetical protein